ncbi:hypothetical protein [Arthrobacter woluwensis]|uniref:hypothetical protein n=1 Tax=Arthrobacter woluwensis TaxID=156980 RepID=UPI0038250A45
MRLILERDESLVGADKKVIRAALVEAKYLESLQYGHDVASMEPLLSIPDAIAWGHTRGADWRRRSDAIITKIIDV